MTNPPVDDAADLANSEQSTAVPGAVESPFSKHPDERAKDMMFAFAKRRPARSELRPTGGDTAPWDALVLKNYNSRLSIALITLVALAPVPLGSNRPVFWMVLAVVVFALLGIYLSALSARRIRLRKALWQMPVIATLAIGFLGFALFQTVPVNAPWPFTSPDPGGGGAITLSLDATRIAALRWASYAVFFFLMLQVVDNRTRARRLSWALFLVVSVHAAFALVSFRFLGDAFFWGPKEAYQTVVTGTFVNRNSFATFAGFGAILGFSLLLHETLRTRRTARSRFWMISLESIRSATLWICLFVILAALLATGSRMGVAGTGAGLVVAFITLMRKHARPTSRLRVVLIIVGLGTMIGAFMIFGQVALDRAIFSARDGGTRLDLYKQVSELIGARPFSGFGLDSFPLAFEQIHRPPVSPDLVWGRAHSTYLTLWSEMGLVFGSLPLFICAVLAVRMLRSVSSQQRDYVLAVAGLGIMTLAALHSLVDFSLEMPANVYLFLAILALGAPSGKQGKGAMARSK